MINYSIKIAILCIISLICGSSVRCLQTPPTAPGSFQEVVNRVFRKIRCDFPLAKAFDRCMSHARTYCRNGKWCRRFNKKESCERWKIDSKCIEFGKKKQCSNHRYLKNIAIRYPCCKNWRCRWCTRNVGRWAHKLVCNMVINHDHCLRDIKKTICQIKKDVVDLKNCVGGWINSARCGVSTVAQCMWWSSVCKHSNCFADMLQFVHK